MRWRIRKKVQIGTSIRVLRGFEPRNSATDPAFAYDFNLPLPEQNSPGTTGMAAVLCEEAVSDVPGTPSNERLRELATGNPPPPEWFESDEECLFQHGTVLKLCQGRIVLAKVRDPEGRNPKVRPLVIVTASSKLTSCDIFVAVAVTSQFTDPLGDDEVCLPWHRDGLGRTQLRRHCVAKCSWLLELRREDIIESRGIVPSEQMTEIIQKLPS